jgi:hypothetical protein
MNYWPNAIAIDELGTFTELFTYNSVNSINECEKTFRNWQDSYHNILVSSWITDDNNSIVQHNSYVNNYGLVDLDGNKLPIKKVQM